MNTLIEFGTKRIGTIRCLILAATLALTLIGALAPMAAPVSAIEPCPEGYVTEKATGNCVPVLYENVPIFGTTEREDGDPDPVYIPIDIVETEPDPEIPLDPDLVDVVPTPIIDAPDGDSVDIPLEDPVVVPEETEEGYVTVRKYECYADLVDAATRTLDELRNYCPPMADIGFAVGNHAEGGPVAGSVPGTTDSDGLAFWPIQDPQIANIREYIPTGFGEPRVFCAIADGPGSPQELTASSGIVDYPLAPGKTAYCEFFNLPAVETAEESGTVTVRKFECAIAADQIVGEPPFEEWCPADTATPMDGVSFELFLDDVSKGEATTDNGYIIWSNIGAGHVFIEEQVPDGYFPPAWKCVNENAEDIFSQMSADAIFEFSGSGEVVCDVFNIRETDDTGSIHIFKFLCPAGYDWTAPNANPLLDCDEPQNNVEFRVTGDQYDSAYFTGVAADGVAAFPGLSAGTYQVQETVPAGIEKVFVYDCQGSSYEQIQNVPLMVGSELLINVAAGDDVECTWFNVPAKEDTGSVTVVKYACTTDVFVGSDYCQIYEGGVEFQLSVAGGDVVAKGTTGNNGEFRFDDLAFGTYQIDESDGEWCHAWADSTNDNGDLIVGKDEVTVVVYNCGYEFEEEKPNKFPNTGAGPHVSEVTLDAPVSGSSETVETPPSYYWTGVLDGRIAASFRAADRPARLLINAIEVDASVETLEIVAGAFQDPTSADAVAWYRETAAPGNSGNAVFAGHLNYWGDPEGVFFRLNGVQEGDIVTVEMISGASYRYQVTSVELVDANNAEIVADATDSGDASSLTLVTCGGEWDPTSRTYLQRTVVHAEQV